ncbi:hypothetical protein [Solilutibacter silvestris]|uniref:hypothetical protein n=1 Tax=Solilutibacter silvestris TaxID=1645665 RepID=UPI003D357AFE
MKQRVRMGGIVLGIAALAFCADASAGLPWGKKKDDAKKDDDKAKTEQTDHGPMRTVKGKDGVEGEIYGTAAAGSPFSKLEIGMPQKQVQDLIGHRDADCGAYVTGKAWIPFYHGGDTHRWECAYKGLGRLIFSSPSAYDSRSVLIKIVNDPKDSGYR